MKDKITLKDIIKHFIESDSLQIGLEMQPVQNILAALYYCNYRYIDSKILFLDYFEYNFTNGKNLISLKGSLLNGNFKLSKDEENSK